MITTGILFTVFTLFPVGDVIVVTDKQGVDDITVKQPTGSADQASILDIDVVFGESNQTGFEKFLDETEPFGVTATEKLAIETAVSLFTTDCVLEKSTQEQLKECQIKTSTFLDIPITEKLVLYDDKGNLLDLGIVQVVFFAKTRNIEDITVKGTTEFYFNDKSYSNKKILYYGRRQV